MNFLFKTKNGTARNRRSLFKNAVSISMISELQLLLIRNMFLPPHVTIENIFVTKKLGSPIGLVLTILIDPVCLSLVLNFYFRGLEFGLETQ